MRREDFFDEINSFDDLSWFCSNVGLEDYMDGYSDTREGWFVDDIYNAINNADEWESLRDYLNDMYDIYNNYSWAYYDGGWEGADHDRFTELRDEIYEAAIEHDCFDDEVEEELVIEETEDDTPDDICVEEPIEDEGCSISDMAFSSRDVYTEFQSTDIIIEETPTETVDHSEYVEEEPFEVLFEF